MRRDIKLIIEESIIQRNLSKLSKSTVEGLPRGPGPGLQFSNRKETVCYMKQCEEFSLISKSQKS